MTSRLRLPPAPAVRERETARQVATAQPIIARLVTRPAVRTTPILKRKEGSVPRKGSSVKVRGKGAHAGVTPARGRRCAARARAARSLVVFVCTRTPRSSPFGEDRSHVQADGRARGRVITRVPGARGPARASAYVRALTRARARAPRLCAVTSSVTHPGRTTTSTSTTLSARASAPHAPHVHARRHEHAPRVG